MQSLFAAAADGLLHSPDSMLTNVAAPAGRVVTAAADGGDGAPASIAADSNRPADLLALTEDEDEPEPPHVATAPAVGASVLGGSSCTVDGNPSAIAFPPGTPFIAALPTAEAASPSAAAGPSAPTAAAAAAAEGGRNKPRQQRRRRQPSTQTNAAAVSDGAGCPSPLPSRAARAGAVFALHALHETQALPSSAGVGVSATEVPPVRAYLPLPALRVALALLEELAAEGAAAGGCGAPGLSQLHSMLVKLST